MLTLYSKSHCAGCIAAANYLTSLDIPFKLVKIDEDAEAKAFIVNRGFRTVPQIFFGEYISIEGGWEGLKKMSKEDILELLG